MSRILAAMLSLALALTPFVSCSDASVAPSRATADALADWVVIPRGDGPIDDDAPAPPPAYNADSWLRRDLVFVTGYHGYDGFVVRMRLDEIGPGIAAD